MRPTEDHEPGGGDHSCLGEQQRARTSRRRMALLHTQARLAEMVSQAAAVVSVGSCDSRASVSPRRSPNPCPAAGAAFEGLASRPAHAASIRQAADWMRTNSVDVHDHQISYRQFTTVHPLSCSGLQSTRRPKLTKESAFCQDYAPSASAGMSPASAVAVSSSFCATALSRTHMLDL